MTWLRRLTGRIRIQVAALALLAGAAAGCAHTLDAYAAGIRVQCNLPDATVWIDDLLAGSAAAWKAEGHEVRPGFHRIEIRRPGYYSFFQEVELPAGSHTVVNARLRELLD